MIRKELIHYYKLLDEIQTKANEASCLHGHLGVPDDELGDALLNIVEEIEIHQNKFELSAKEITK